NRGRTAQIVERRRKAPVSLFDQPEEAKIPVMGGGIGVLHYRRTFLKNSCAVSAQSGIMRRTEQTPVMLGKAHAITIVSLTCQMSRAPRGHDRTDRRRVGSIWRLDAGDQARVRSFRMNTHGIGRPDIKRASPRPSSSNPFTL